MCAAHSSNIPFFDLTFILVSKLFSDAISNVVWNCGLVVSLVEGGIRPAIAVLQPTGGHIRQ